MNMQPLYAIVLRPQPTPITTLYSTPAYTYIWLLASLPAQTQPDAMRCAPSLPPCCKASRADRDSHASLAFLLKALVARPDQSVGDA